MRAFRGIHHSITKETSNFMMQGKETCLSDTLQYNPSPSEESLQNKYVIAVRKRIKVAHQLLRDQQAQVKKKMRTSPCGLLVTIWFCWKIGTGEWGTALNCNDLLPFAVLESYPNHTYRINQQGQRCLQN